MTRTMCAKAKVGTRLGSSSPQHDEDDSEDDHDIYLISMRWCVALGAVVSWFKSVGDFFVSCLFAVALEPIDASLDAQPGVAGGAAEILLRGALGGLDLMRELLSDAHCGFSLSWVKKNFFCMQQNSARVNRLPAFGDVCGFGGFCVAREPTEQANPSAAGRCRLRVRLRSVVAATGRLSTLSSRSWLRNSVSRCDLAS